MYNLTNSTDPTAVLINLAQNVPVLFPMLLVMEFLVIALGGAFSQQRRTGFTNVPQWFSIAGLVTSTTSFILFMVEIGGQHLIPLTTVVVTVVITFASVFWFFLSDNE